VAYLEGVVRLPGEEWASCLRANRVLTHAHLKTSSHKMQSPPLSVNVGGHRAWLSLTNPSQTLRGSLAGVTFRIALAAKLLARLPSGQFSCECQCGTTALLHDDADDAWNTPVSSLTRRFSFLRSSFESVAAMPPICRCHALSQRRVGQWRGLVSLTVASLPSAARAQFQAFRGDKRLGNVELTFCGDKKHEKHGGACFL